MAITEEKKGTIAVSLTNFLDSGCIVASSVAMTVGAAAFKFDSTGVAILGAIGANAFGAAIGALIGGFLTDRFGRKLIYTYNLLVYSLGVFLCMIAFNLPMLVIGIVLSGLSVGAGVPASGSYISEMSSSTKRAENIGISQFAGSCGPAIIFALSLILSFIIPSFVSKDVVFPAGTYGPFDGVLGMRIIYFILLVVALVAGNLQRQLKESKDWEEKNKQSDINKTHANFRRMMLDALKNVTNVKTIIFLVAVYLTGNIVAGTQGQFLPFMYQAAGGLSETQTSLLNMITGILTAMGSILIFSKLGDRVPHRILFFITALMAVLAGVVMVFFGIQMKAGHASEFGWLLGVFVGLGGISAGFSAQCFYALGSTELFPTRYRGGVQGVMFFLVRGVLGIGSLVAVAGLNIGTPSGFITSGIIMTVILLVSLVVGVIWCPQTQGKTLDEITKERYGDNI